MRGPGSLAATVVIIGLLLIELLALWRYTPRRLAADLAQSPSLPTRPRCSRPAS